MRGGIFKGAVGNGWRAQMVFPSGSGRVGGKQPFVAAYGRFVQICFAYVAGVRKVCQRLENAVSSSSEVDDAFYSSCAVRDSEELVGVRGGFEGEELGVVVSVGCSCRFEG